MPDILTADLCDRFRDESLALAAGFRVLPPAWRHYGGRRRFHGVVRTLRCFEDNTLLKAAVESPGLFDSPSGRVPGVLVVDAGASLRRALVGGNLAAAALAQGWAGLLIDGAVRDSVELAALGVGVLALATTPMPGTKRAQMPPAGERDVPVSVQGILVQPGDWLYADEDGVVVCATAL